MHRAERLFDHIFIRTKITLGGRTDVCHIVKMIGGGGGKKMFIQQK
jgi:hypothetical protein